MKKRLLASSSHYSSFESVSVSISLSRPPTQRQQGQGEKGLGKGVSANSVIRADGSLLTPPPRKNRSAQGSTTSINSFLDARGRLVTPPPRKLNRATSKNSVLQTSSANVQGMADPRSCSAVPPGSRLPLQPIFPQGSSGNETACSGMGNARMNHVYNGSTVSLNRGMANNQVCSRLFTSPNVWHTKLFVFPTGDPKQSARSHLTPVSDTAF